MPTILDVAAAAGVSVATVSRALRTPDVVAEATRIRVLDTVKALGYVPNAAAKSLRTARSGRILVTVPDIANPFFSQVIRGIEEAAKNADYSVILVDTQYDPEIEAKHSTMLCRREADGLIFLGHALPFIFTDMVRSQGARVPIVNGCEFGPELGVSSVHIDNRQAAREMMEHLYGLGHRHIGIITGPLVSPLSRDRLAGVKDVAKQWRAQKDLDILSGDFSIQSGATAATNLLQRNPRPSAIFCFSDEMALGAMHVVKQAGLRVPQDVAVAGFDNINFGAFADPSITTIDQPAAEIGRETVRLLMGILQGNARRTHVTLPHRLVIRESTAMRVD